MPALGLTCSQETDSNPGEQGGAPGRIREGSVPHPSSQDASPVGEKARVCTLVYTLLAVPFCL